jgi:hypothetical protein
MSGLSGVKQACRALSPENKWWKPGNESAMLMAGPRAAAKEI